MDINTLLLVLHVALALGIIGLVLLQKGKGAGEGAAFGGGGGGGSGSVFGAAGTSNFLSRTTAILAVIFFINSLVLANLAANRDIEKSVLDNMSLPAAEEAMIPVETMDESVPMPIDTFVNEEIPPPE